MGCSSEALDCLEVDTAPVLEPKVAGIEGALVLAEGKEGD